MSDLRAFLVDRHNRLGPIFDVPHPDRPTTVIAGPEGNLFVARHGAEYLSSEESWRDFNREFGLPSRVRDGDSHRQRRAMHQRAFSRGMVIDRVPEMVAIAREVVAGWEPGQELSLLSDLERIAAEQLGRLLVGRSPGDDLESFLTLIHTVRGATLARCEPREALVSPGYLRAKGRAFRVAREIVDAHRADGTGASRRDHVDEMLAAVDRDPREFGEADLLMAALGPFVAGIGTVPPRAEYLIEAIVSRPQILDRVVAEVDHAFADGDLTWAKVRDMKAPFGAMMEMLRHCAAVHMQRYTAATEFTFAGVRVERGQSVTVAGTLSHWLPQLFADPLRFDVDRYRAPRNEHRQPGAFTPFGVGEHSCPGAGIAELQLMANTAAIMRDVELELASPDGPVRVAARRA